MVPDISRMSTSLWFGTGGHRVEPFNLMHVLRPFFALHPRNPMDQFDLPRHFCSESLVHLHRTHTCLVSTRFPFTALIKYEVHRWIQGGPI
jgi:hypothetical protein